MTAPPFRADLVGNLLRPVELREARAKAAFGAMSVAQVRVAEDRDVRGAAAKQESL